MTKTELAKLVARNPDIVVMEDGRVLEVLTTASGSSNPAPVKMSEHDMQTLVIQECEVRALTNPDWQMIAACPNGQYRKGQRMEAGLRAGFPDLMCLLPRIKGNVHRHGAFCEIKITPNKPTDAQNWWLRRLRVEGYVCEVIYDDPAKVIAFFEWYVSK